ncbi:MULTISPECIES: hypothetical protein [unclassified Sphingomonas]|uniref:hypothetical protein n=1 Tax=unclassified Sphingomonas TaxID=196159 RepID=UPI000AEE0B49|nr:MULTISPECIES: hypothetical protein [unclassified Sphingomonas]
MSEIRHLRARSTGAFGPKRTDLRHRDRLRTIVIQRLWKSKRGGYAGMTGQQGE